MSVAVMTEVWKLDVPHHEQSVLLALADHGDDNGANVFPSIGYVAWKTGYSERQVHRIMADLRSREVLVVTRAARGKFPAHYRLNLAKLPKKEAYVPRSSREQQPDTSAGSPEADSGDAAILSGVSGGAASGVTSAPVEDDVGAPTPDVSLARGDISGAHADTAVSDKPSLVNRHGKPSLETPRESPPRASAREGPIETNDFVCPQCGADGAIVRIGDGPRICVRCARARSERPPPRPDGTQQLPTSSVLVPAGGPARTGDPSP